MEDFSSIQRGQKKNFTTIKLTGKRFEVKKKMEKEGRKQKADRQRSRVIGGTVYRERRRAFKLGICSIVRTDSASQDL